MIHKGKPDLAVLMLGKKAPAGDDAPDGDEGDAYSSDAEESACKELWEAIKGDDYGAFRDALDAWFQAKEAAPHEENEEGR